MDLVVSEEHICSVEGDSLIDDVLTLLIKRSNLQQTREKRQKERQLEEGGESVHSRQCFTTTDPPSTHVRQIPPQKAKPILNDTSMSTCFIRPTNPSSLIFLPHPTSPDDTSMSTCFLRPTTPSP